MENLRTVHIFFFPLWLLLCICNELNVYHYYYFISLAQHTLNRLFVVFVLLTCVSVWYADFSFLLHFCGSTLCYCIWLREKKMKKKVRFYWNQTRTIFVLALRHAANTLWYNRNNHNKCNIKLHLGKWMSMNMNGFVCQANTTQNLIGRKIVYIFLIADVCFFFFSSFLFFFESFFFAHSVVRRSTHSFGTSKRVQHNAIFSSCLQFFVPFLCAHETLFFISTARKERKNNNNRHTRIFSFAASPMCFLSHSILSATVWTRVA